jgi:hypothetical protein
LPDPVYYEDPEEETKELPETAQDEQVDESPELAPT